MPYKDPKKNALCKKLWAKRHHNKVEQSQHKYSTEKKWMLTYSRAKFRCNNSNAKDYHRYGGRGIKFLLTKEEIKKLWFRDKAYSMKQPSIDRIDNDGHYSFKNCHFIEMIENNKKQHIDRRKKT